jgi:ABC-type branched-subunit amino acid transport system permease subunit
VTQYLLFVVLGLGAGAVYGLLGLGLVLEYRGSGVVNFAHGAMAMYIAYVFVALRENGSLFVPGAEIHLGDPFSLWPAAIIALLYAALMGYLVYALIFRFLRTASSLNKVVASVGLMLTLQTVVVLHFSTTAQTTAPVLSTMPVSLGSDLVVPRDRLILSGIVIVSAIVLWAIFRYTRFGLATRAAAENEKGALLLGYAPSRIAARNWIIATLIAGASGILLIQITALSPSVYTLLVVPALACALVGRFTSFGGVVAAGFALGIIQSELTKIQAAETWLPQGIQDAVPLLMIIVAIAIRGQVLPSRGALLETRLPRVNRPEHLMFTGLVSAFICLVGIFVLHGGYRFGLIQTLVTAFMCLSLVLLTGYMGQISLAQIAFAGIGGFAMSRVAGNWGVPFPLDLVAAGLVAVPLGVLIGVPAQRARGVSLAVVTLAAGAAASALLFNNPDVNGGFSGSRLPELHVFGINLDIHADNVHDFPRPWYGVVVLVCFTLVGLSIANLRRTATGRRMLAVRANERAAAAAGINVSGTKLFAFVVSSFLAGFGGGLIGYQQGVLSQASFDVFVSLTLLTIAAIGGIGRVKGALLAGLFLAAGGLAPTILDRAIGFGRFLPLIGGVAVIIQALVSPDGIAGIPPPRFFRELPERVMSRVRGRPPEVAPVGARAGVKS